jgi:hypothetical protein
LTDDGNHTVRGVFTPDGQQFFSVYDFICKTCLYKDGAARMEFSRLVDDKSEYQVEIVSLCRYLKFPGRGQRDTPTMTIRGLQRLLMILGGKVAAEYRALVETTFTRVMAGDRSLIKVIESNAISNKPINRAMRAALEQDPSPGGILHDDALDDWTDRKHKREVEELELAERKEALAERMEATDLKRIERHTMLISAYQTLCPGSVLDDRARLLFKDAYLNLCAGQRALTNGVDLGKPLTISTVASDMGLRFTSTELQSLGCKIKGLYKAKYDEDPPKHEQFCNGAVRKVCSYTERDRCMVEQALREAK